MMTAISRLASVANPACTAQKVIPRSNRFRNNQRRASGMNHRCQSCFRAANAMCIERLPVFLAWAGCSPGAPPLLPAHLVERLYSTIRTVSRQPDGRLSFLLSIKLASPFIGSGTSSHEGSEVKVAVCTLSLRLVLHTQKVVH